jgi:hypothetical protein
MVAAARQRLACDRIGLSFIEVHGKAQLVPELFGELTRLEPPQNDGDQSFAV